MKNLKKPISYYDMCKKELFYFRFDLAHSGVVYLPVEVYLYSEALRWNVGTPKVDVRLGDYVYNISINKKPKILTEIPKQYENEVNQVIKFISCNYDILIDHWNGILDDCDLMDAFLGKTSYKAFNGNIWVR